MNDIKTTQKEKRADSAGKAFLLLSSLTLAEKMLGFLLQATIAAIMGATIITDCYYATFELTTLIDLTLISAIVVVLLKKYADELIKNGSVAAQQYLSNARAIIMPIMILLSLTMIVFAEQISYILAPRYQTDARNILVNNIRWLAFLPAINTMNLFYLVILRQKKQFLIVGLKSLFINAFGFLGVGCYLFFQSQTSFYLCLFYNIALIVYGAVAMGASRKWMKLRVVKPRKSNNIKPFLELLIPLVISNGIVRVSLLIDRIISSMMGEGAITCLTYSQMLSYFVEGVFIINISTILLSDFINLVAKNDYATIKAQLQISLSSMIILLLPISIIAFFFSREIASIVFLRGNFTARDIDRVASLLSIYAIGFIPSVISNIMMQTHFAFGKTKRTLKISVISISSNIAISVVLAAKIGLNGVAIGTFCSYVLSAAIYSLKTRELIRSYVFSIKRNCAMKILVSAAVCIGVVLLVKYLHFDNDLVAFIVATMLGIGSYIACLIITREETTRLYLGKTLTMIRHRGKE